MTLTPCSHCDLLMLTLIIYVAFFMVALLTVVVQANLSVGTSIVMNHAQPLHMDVPHFCAWTFLRPVIECTATDHMIFS